MDLDDAIAGLQRQNQVNATKAVSAKLDALQAELTRQKQEEESMPDCPWCGGKIPVGFAKCKNCSSELIWRENLVGKPGDEAKLAAKLQREKANEAAKVIAEQKTRVALRQKQLITNEKANQRGNFLYGVFVIIVIVAVWTLFSKH